MNDDESQEDDERERERGRDSPAAGPAGRLRRFSESRGEAEFDRGLAFFDAIYGFAATLLIANVDPPSADEWQSFAALAESNLFVQLFGVTLSFIIIAVMWRANVQIMRSLNGLDGPTTLANLVASATVVFIPFTTQGISDAETSALAIPTALYAINVAVASLAQTCVFQVGRARGLERVPTTRAENWPVLLDELVAPAVFVLSIPVAFLLDAHWAKISWLTLAIAGPISARLATRASDRARAARSSTTDS